VITENEALAAVAAFDRGVVRLREAGGAVVAVRLFDGGHVRGVDVFAVRDGLVAEKLSYVKG
jgi:hypothetical protein